MSSLNREVFIKSCKTAFILSFLCFSLSFFLLIKASPKADQDFAINLPPINNEGTALDEPGYEAWIIRYLEDYAQNYYTEIHTMHLSNEHIRIQQHKRLASNFEMLFNRASLIVPPRRYSEIHHTLREEAWISSMMHRQYPNSYFHYQSTFFQKMKKRNQVILLMEKQEPKLLYRWLIQEKAAFQSKSQDK